MKKIIMAGVIVVVAGASTYMLTQQDSTTTNQDSTAINQDSTSHNVLDYIPADTPIFAAQLQPFPIKDYIASAPKISPQNQNALYDSIDPAVNFALNLLNTYQTSLADADLFINTFGLPDSARSYFYTLGLLPVFKIEIANEQAIWDLLDKAESESTFTHTDGTLENIHYRAYSISDKKEAMNAQVIIAIDNGLLTITLNSAYHEDKLLAKALGLIKAEESLADSATIEKTIKKYNFKAASIAFINHIELVKGLTTKDGNLLAKQITKFEEELGNNASLSEIRDQQCATEFATIANNWPRTVAGYKQLDITNKESTLEISTIIESNNQVILNALSALRGFIPNYIADIDNNVFAMSLGIDISELSSTLSNVWDDLQTPTYNCQPLANIQAEIATAGDFISMAAMGANMANGVQSISFALLDYTMSKMDTEPQLESVDALLTISTEKPEQLFNSMKMFLPEFQGLQLTEGGEPISLNSLLPIPPEFNIHPKLAIKGKHLMVYVGKKGEQVANKLALETLAKNGIYEMSFDFNKVFTPLIAVSELSGEEIPKEMIFLSEYDTRMQMSLDVNKHGFILNSKINNKASD